MSQENKKMYVSGKSTGTIPKVKHRNNNNAGAGTERRSNLVSNNLGNEFEPLGVNRGNRNHNRNLHYYHMMDVNQENGVQNGVFVPNGMVTSNESNTMSRRNSSGLSKCDNITKYPDKKQIESKLSQIQEYLQVATSMKANMKKTDEQIQSVSIIDTTNNLNEDEPMDAEQLDAVIKDLTDSANKLQFILDDIDGRDENNSNQFSDGSEHNAEVIRQNKNELERKVDLATRDLQMLKEQENYLLHLQLNAENKLREARHAQEKLAKSTPAVRNTNSESDWCNASNAFSMSDSSSGGNIDMRELEERIKSFNVDESKADPKLSDFNGQIDQLQNHIQQMRDGNDNRQQLIQILDTRDSQLQAQHNSLQGKLLELQTKKLQVDQLVVQLQTMNEQPVDDEMGCQVKKIVNMKEQLNKLKDMLNLVQHTENSMGNEHNDGIHEEIEENVDRLIAKTDNMMQQQHSNRVPHVENVELPTGRSNYPSSSSNERRVNEKQVNKKSMSANEKERMKLQAEMRAKRQELEELMCKHKAANSNLNQDTHSEKNSEVGACGNSHYENSSTNAWFPMDSNIYSTRVEQASSESDDCPEEDPNEFSEINSSSELNTAAGVTQLQPMPVFSYPTTNYIRKRSQEPQSPRVDMPHDSIGTLSSQSPARSVRSATPAFPPRENASRSQIQKQLELIKTVCDSMLESNDEAQQSAPARVRNNLTPSPIYSEPRHFSNVPSTGNVIDVTHGYEGSHLYMPAPPNISPNDTTAYNNWLTTNSLQTQAFILNTLNQCCQMMWQQQKELSNLRNTVNVMQDRFYHDDNSQQTLYMQSNPCIYQPNLQIAHANNCSYRHPMKTNQLAAHHQQQSQQPQNLNTGSMPNLNGCSHPATTNATNMEHAAFCNNTPSIGEHQLNTNHIMHPNNVPTPIWNGQAINPLNNQVAPGNRANNYWDNFRSYSRQNLFSTKSNDGIQSTQNIFNDRANQYEINRRPMNQMNQNQDVSSTSSAGITSLLAKSNSNQNEATSTVSTSASVESSPRRISVPKRRVVPTVNTRCAEPPPSIELDTQRPEVKPTNNEGSFMLPALPSLSSYSLSRMDSQFAISNVGDPEILGNTGGRRKEWILSNDSVTTTDSGNTQQQKFRLVEDLRENVYKEVASLISANEDRPHFLIQLFQDLQLVSSDPLRRHVLQSVQELITNSLAASVTNAVNSTRQQHQPDDTQPRQPEKYSITEESNAEYELFTITREASATTSDGNMSDITETQNDLQRASAMWPLITKHAMNASNGQDIEELREHNFQDASMQPFLNLRHNDGAYLMGEDQIKFISPFEAGCGISTSAEEEIPRLQILVQNGDLAEADQSCAPEEDDEGAVGGLLNILERSSSSNTGLIHLEEEELNVDTEEENGLDQVPTRLQCTCSKSGSRPPSRCCSAAK